MKSLIRSLSIVLVLLSPTASAARDFLIESVVDTRFEGVLASAMGLASRLTGTDLRNVQTTAHLKGHQMRIDSAITGSIFDLDAERVIQIDHKQKTYTSTTFAEMRATFERAQASAEEARAKQ